ncbi:DUF3237 domain-containing protein [Pseudomonas aeruginosa]|uniref:DUF3237 domain-containing protein n=1 Tax=Pseudomonas aeruginosa TaxID=287 RepID=UPI00053D52D6|nr:DUF3237 domain-containing protein [Pseudomonas aeruginosa]MCO2031125.1 DUF3237 domain-containing protein [Pseudomonas aeruginosa]MCS7675732.1 DUF3237 domain-containing protein [Pseudomonas aeruginosa]MCS7905039.1 DUF3237 domain-containing protein [Pseudomonas aeruginosa]MCS9345802.1 DUF3237 domain-containing protein [Pseudomonas aeruginosa]MCS9358641.1 DUF3237 domain-containing protein [Pseudomonas aeruginosa]
MSEPKLHLAMCLNVWIGPGIDRGLSEHGQRIDYPILGGRFAGPGLTGEIPSEGADYYLERADGNGVLNAQYSLRCDDGALIKVHNRGLLILSDKGHELARDAWPIPDKEYRCRCTPQFSTDSPRYQWLMQHMFLGVITYPTEHGVWIECYRVD